MTSQRQTGGPLEGVTTSGGGGGQVDATRSATRASSAPPPAAPAALPRSADSALRGIAARHGLNRLQRSQLERLLALIARDAMAPTAVRDPDRAVALHVADSLAALDLPAVRNARRIVDIGSGAGFPGLPLAIALPDAQVTLLESSSRKCRFLRDAVTVCGASNATVVCDRAELWGQGRGAHDLAVARALAAAPVVEEYAAPLLAGGGFLVDWRGQTADAGDAQALAAAAILGLRREGIVQVEPQPAAHAHYLHIYLKVRDTPERFPRRPGIARKRPLPA